MLAPVEASTADTLIAYAAAPGHVALDGDGAQSPFTAALVRHLTTPGLDVELTLRRVRDDVVAATDHGQVPFKTGSLGGDEILLGGLADGSMRPPLIAAEPEKPAAPAEIAMIHPPKPNAGPSTGSTLSAKPTLVATYGAWGAYEAQGPKGKICYALSQPKARAPVSLHRDDGFIFVSTRPGEHVRDEVSIMTGVGLQEGVDVAQAEIGSANFTLITRGQNMWLKDPNEEAQFVRAIQMLSSERLVVKAATRAGDVAIDTYSLKGFGYALERVTHDCP